MAAYDAVPVPSKCEEGLTYYVSGSSVSFTGPWETTVDGSIKWVETGTRITTQRRYALVSSGFMYVLQNSTLIRGISVRGHEVTLKTAKVVVVKAD